MTLIFLISRDLHGEKLLDDPVFKSHAAGFLQIVGQVASHLMEGDLEAKVGPNLMMLGARHAAVQGFDLYFVEIFTKCMHFTWGNALGEEYTEDVRDAWSAVFDFIVKKMQDGYYIYKDDQQNDNLLHKLPQYEYIRR